MGTKMERGVNYPFTISKDNGEVLCSGEMENIRQSVFLILMTEPGERIMRPDFGTRLHQYVFENMDVTTRDRIRREVINSLTRWENRIYNITVEAYADRKQDGRLCVDVGYTLQGSLLKDEVSVQLT